MSQPVSKFVYGDFEIESSAFFLPALHKWQPMLTVTRVSGGALLPRSKTFTGLQPIFDTAAHAADWARNSAIQWIDEADSCIDF